MYTHIVTAKSIKDFIKKKAKIGRKKYIISSDAKKKLIEFANKLAMSMLNRIKKSPKRSRMTIRNLNIYKDALKEKSFSKLKNRLKRNKAWIK